MLWNIITGEYPPQQGGVADYTRLVALGLAARGSRVLIWAPGSENGDSVEEGIEVRRIPGGFGPRSLNALGRAIAAAGPGEILVQYVPQGFGLRGMNLPLCLWLFERRRAGITVMFHEVTVGLSWDQPMRHNAIGAVNNAMAFVLTRAARRCFVGAAAWEARLRALSPEQVAISWLPVPSNLPVVEDAAGVRAIRERIVDRNGLILGHFGTARETWIADRVAEIAPAVLHERANSVLLLLGRDSANLRNRVLAHAPEFHQRVHAAGPLAPSELSRFLCACDAMFQPYGDGVSTRRGTIMAALAHRRPVVTTAGFCTEPLWSESGAVSLAPSDDIPAMCAATARLLGDLGERERLGSAAGELYENRFDIRHTIDALCEI
jgi:glycosyltransferase involved in cell wall biosynthesis